MRGFIWKFGLEVGLQAVYMPRGSTILHVEGQGTSLQMWAACDPSKDPSSVRMIRVVLTGDRMPESRYVGTALLRGGSLVLHVFDEGER